MSNVAEHIIRRFKELGIRRVFGVPSGSWLYYMEAMRKSEVDFILVSNEGAASVMADVTARLSGIPGACYGTVGPGATNLSTGVGGALLDRSPVLALSSEPPEPMLGRTVQMAVDQQALFRPLTKYSTRLAPDRVDQELLKAVTIAVSEMPGPVHLGLPEDLGARTAPESFRPFRLPAASPVPVAAPEDLADLERLFAGASKPLLAVGLSAVRAGVADLVRRIAEKHRVPVVLTPMAKGMLAEDHEWYAGVLFHALSDVVSKTYLQADLVVGVGYDPIEFNYEDWMPDATLAHLDSVPADIDRMRWPRILDALGNIRASLERLEALKPIASAWDAAALAARRTAMFAAFEPPAGSFGARAALKILREVLPDDGIMACDVGAHTHLIGQMWRTPAPGLQIMTNGWSAMGFGVPAAIAAKLERPETKVACVTGDGGFLMNVGELAVARRERLAVVFVILADRKLELIRLKQDKKRFDGYGVDLDTPEVPSADYIFGVPVITADDQDSYRAALEKAFAMDGPVVVEAKIAGGDYDELILRKHR